MGHRLSDAIDQGQEFAAVQLHEGGYYRFNAEFSANAQDIQADTLFTAYLGERRGPGILEIVRALRGGDGDRLACRIIFDCLMRHWSVLGAAMSEAARVTVAKHPDFMIVPHAPHKGLPAETLFSYVCRLNRTQRRAEIASLLRSLGY